MLIFYKSIIIQLQITNKEYYYSKMNIKVVCINWKKIPQNQCEYYSMVQTSGTYSCGRGWVMSPIWHS